MPLKAKRKLPAIQSHTTAHPLSRGLSLAVSCAADVSDPQARQASVLQRIKETTAFHWGMGVANQSAPQRVLGAFKPICHRATVWFAN